jgi:hypothetical protein
LGDIDVVAWSDTRPDIWLIECKRLQPTRTVGEIADRLVQFRGESGDLLGKHLARVAWVRNNPTALRQVIRANDLANRNIEDALVTNGRVPMQYMTDLPLPADRIVSIDQLVERIGR